MPEPEYEYKAFAEVKALDQDAGGFEGYASLFGVRDAIGDVVKPGAFSKGLRRFVSDGFIALNHDWQSLPIGTIAEAHEDDKGLFLRGAYHSTPEAQAARRVAAERHERGKPMGLSIAFTIAEGGAKQTRQGRDLLAVDLHEISQVNVPMLRPARITGVKSMAELKSAIASHSTATSEGSWDGPGAQRRLSNEAGAATYRRAYAWVNPDGDPDTLAAYSFIHHEVNGDGVVGAANLTACSAGIAILNGGRTRPGASRPWADDREGIWRHLARHLRDGDREPPELRGLSDLAMLARALDLVDACAQLKSAGDLAQARAMLAILEPSLHELTDWLHADQKTAEADRALRERLEHQRRHFRAAHTQGVH